MAKMLTDILDIKYPIIMAPMFLVSDESMILSALETGITAAFPAANYRTVDELRNAITRLKSKSLMPFGVNIIANPTNPKFKDQLKACVDLRVGFVITSLGNPKPVISECHAAGIPVFCDVTDVKHAQKVVDLGADAIVAVNNLAGGHPGSRSGEDLCKELLAKFDIPVVYAGGISNAQKMDAAFELGVAGVSLGTLFLATDESPISPAYKEAIIKFGSSDIVKTEKLSGSELNVINTDYVKKIGTKSNPLSRFLYRHKKLRRYMKHLAMNKGMKALEKAAFSATYKNVWVAGPSIGDIHDIESVSSKVDNLVNNSKILKR